MKIKMTQREFDEKFDKVRAAMNEIGVGLNIFSSNPIQISAWPIESGGAVTFTVSLEIIPEIPAEGELIFIKGLVPNKMSIMKSMGVPYDDMLVCIGGEFTTRNTYHAMTWCQVSDKAIHSDNWDPEWVENFA